MLPVRHLRSILMFLIVKSLTGLILRPTVYKVEPDYDELLHDYSAEDDTDFIVIVIKDLQDYTDDYTPKERKGMSIDFKQQNSTNITTLKSDVKPVTQKLLEPKKDSDDDENKKGHGDFDGLKLTRQQKNMLRKKWRASCDKKAAKACRKACLAATKNACRAYRCKKGLKGHFKKECKNSCKSKFLGSKGGKSSDSD